MDNMFDDIFEDLDFGEPNEIKTIKIAGKSLSDGLKETAFSWAVDIVVADGWLDEKERKYLELVVSAFSIDQDVAKKIVEVTKIRNRVQ